MLQMIQNIPNVNTYPLTYVFEHMKLQHKPDTLWLEFGVASGRSINYISQFTKDKVYGFDSFEGLPETWRDCFEKGSFSRNGETERVLYELCMLWVFYYNQLFHHLFYTYQTNAFNFLENI